MERKYLTSFGKKIRLGLEFSMVYVMLIKLQSKSRLVWTTLRCLKLELCHAFQINKISTSMLAVAGLYFIWRGWLH